MQYRSLFGFFAAVALIPLNATAAAIAQVPDSTLAQFDSDNDGLNDFVESLLELDPNKPYERLQKSAKPFTSFQTHSAYREDHDLKTDAVLVFSSSKEVIESWQKEGYIVKTMYGFRAGPNYVAEHEDEVQTSASGELLQCGPGSYYMVPTKNRIDVALDYFRTAIQNGTSAVCPEEPEFWANAGYSNAFKREWKDFYNEEWVDPSSSVLARWKSENLKAFLQLRMIRSILEDAKKQNPNIIGMVAHHSPVNYFTWAVPYYYHQINNIPQLDEIIGQVWTGTARSACKYEGVMAERTFENAFLEYSSLYNHIRGTEKRMWFLMDPLEDNPDRTMADYHTNYHLTLIASLLFPEVDAFEVLPWPARIFNRVPEDFATSINIIIRALQDMHKQSGYSLNAGTEGIAVLIADSIGMQRAAPHRSNSSGFYGLTLPLVYKGIPVQIAQLERVGEPGYLDTYRVILLSYDLMKPVDESYGLALAKWVKNGGVLIFFGGSDPYNDLPEWWAKKGYSTPQEQLFQELGLEVGKHITSIAKNPEFVKILEADKRYMRGENFQVYEIDLTPHAGNGGYALLRFRDKYLDDGWGPFLSQVTIRVNGKFVGFFNPGSAQELKYLVEDSESARYQNARFADGNSYWVYRFPVKPGTKVTIGLRMQNQFLVEAASGQDFSPWLFKRSAKNSLTKDFPQIVVPASTKITSYTTAAPEIYSANVTGKAFFEHKSGKGKLVFVGIQPEFFASSAISANLLRALVRYSCESAGLKYKESGFFSLKRGRYQITRTLSASHGIQGRYIDILSPELQLVENITMPPNSVSLLYNITNIANNHPQLLFCSSKVEQLIEQSGKTYMMVSGPTNVKAVARIWRAGRKLVRSEAFSANGEKLELETRVDGETVFIKHDGVPKGAVVRLFWE